MSREGEGEGEARADLMTLPVELHAHVMSFLGADALGHLAKTCRHFYALVVLEPPPFLWDRAADAALGTHYTTLHRSLDAMHGTASNPMKLCIAGSAANMFRLDSMAAREAIAAFQRLPDASRSGHTATPVLHDKLLVLGGLISNSFNLRDLWHPALMDLTTLACHPIKETGCKVEHRLRHMTCSLTPTTVLVHGGYSPISRHAYSDSILGKLSRGADGSYEVAWERLQTTGQKPATPYHHTASVVQDGRRMAVLGGPMEYAEEGSYSLTVYLLDIAARAWTTICPRGPGPRTSLFQFSVWHEHNGRGRYIVFGGSTRENAKAHALDLETQEWAESADRALENKDRGSFIRYGRDTVLVFGGTQSELEGFAQEILKLDLRTLTWSIPVVRREPGPWACNTGGQASAAGVLFGGFDLEAGLMTTVARMSLLRLWSSPPKATVADVRLALMTSDDCAARGEEDAESSLAELHELVLSLVAMPSLGQTLLKVLDAAATPTHTIADLLADFPLSLMGALRAELGLSSHKDTPDLAFQVQSRISLAWAFLEAGMRRQGGG